MSQRVYKFISAQFGISDLKERRVKLSMIDDLNDPFDVFHALDTTDPQHAKAVMGLAARFGNTVGLLCFSRNWNNLLLWSHYAASHTGICLGFDIPDDVFVANAMDVRYQPNLLKIHDSKDLDSHFGKRLFCTKHESWSYEQEVRFFFELEDLADEHGFHWFQFGPVFQLREVILGVRCCDDHAHKVCEALKEYPDQIECTRAYMRNDAFLLNRRDVDPLSADLVVAQSPT